MQLGKWIKEQEFKEPMGIFGVDPGVTTGYSLLLFDLAEGVPLPGDDRIRVFQGQLSYGGSGNAKDLIANPEGAFIEQKICYELANLFTVASTHCHPSVLVIEDFIIRKQNSTRDFLAPVRITSGLLQEVFAKGLNVVFQSPADAKSVCTDKRMDKWGYTIKTQKDRHSRDALRHSVLYLRKLSEKPKLLSYLS